MVEFNPAKCRIRIVKGSCVGGCLWMDMEDAIFEKRETNDTMKKKMYEE